MLVLVLVVVALLRCATANAVASAVALANGGSECAGNFGLQLPAAACEADSDGAEKLEDTLCFRDYRSQTNTDHKEKNHKVIGKGRSYAVASGLSGLVLLEGNQMASFRTIALEMRILLEFSFEHCHALPKDETHCKHKGDITEYLGNN